MNLGFYQKSSQARDILDTGGWWVCYTMTKNPERRSLAEALGPDKAVSNQTQELSLSTRGLLSIGYFGDLLGERER